MAGSRGYGHYGNYTSGYSNYNSTALPYSLSSSSFSSNYYSLPSYGQTSSYHHHHVASPGSRGVSAGLSSFNFDLPRSNYGLKPSYVPPSSRPIRIMKPSMPSISETHVFSSSRPTPPPLSPPLTIYRPLAALAAAQEKEKAANAKRNSGRWNVRNTANIDVVTRPRSRIDHDKKKDEDASTHATTGDSAAAAVPFFLQRTEGGGVVQRDFTVGTLKRGRKVIRLQTTRLPTVEQESPPPAPEPLLVQTPPSSPPATVTVEVPQTTRVIRAYGVERLEPAVIPGRVKKTPGERMKEKFLIPSRKGPGQPKRLFAGGVNQLSSAPPPPVVATPLPLINDSGLGSSPVVSSVSSSIPNAPNNDQSTVYGLLSPFY